MFFQLQSQLGVGPLAADASLAPALYTWVDATFNIQNGNDDEYAATLTVLGGSRWQILAAYGVEYGAVGLIAGIAGVALGYAAAWPVVVMVFEAEWSVDWAGVAALLGGAAGLATLGGLLAAMQALSERPAPVLRAE